ncbi:MAG: TrkH family potassium uptake protein [Halobacteriota archaeon]
MARLDWRASVGLVGTVLKYLSFTMLVPLAVGLFYGEDAWVFAASLAVVFTAGFLLERLETDPNLRIKEAILMVSLAWLAAAVAGTLPYMLASIGSESVLGHPVNALFESTSGFTTTGSTVMEEISFDRHSHALLLWRQLTQWLGGMGIIVLMVAILPEVAVNGAQLMKSEAPGPSLQKLTPRIRETARALWLIYAGFTAFYVALLYGLHLSGYAPEMDAYNAVAHGFSTLPTGGFSPQEDSIAAFSPVVQWTVVPFMVFAGVNFALYWRLFRGDIRSMVRDVELKTYVGALFATFLALWTLLYRGAAPALERGGATEGLIVDAARQAAFQIGSLLNSTGFATSDFAQWDTSAQMVLLFAMFIGGSAGSTGGGIKVIRWLVVLKAARRELYRTAKPDVVHPVRLGGQVVDEEAVRGIMGFTLLYLVLLGVGAVFIAVDSGRAGLDLTALEALSAALATIGNIGPGFGRIGPYGNFLFFPDTSKLLMVFLMWAGRLEIIPVLVLLTRSFWRE